jgi:hypothetical protein
MWDLLTLGKEWGVFCVWFLVMTWGEFCQGETVSVFVCVGTIGADACVGVDAVMGRLG